MTHSARPAFIPRIRSLVVACAALALLLVGCRGGDAPAVTPASPASPPVSPTPLATPAAPLPAPVANAQRQAAQDAGVGVEQAVIVSYDRQEFPTAALGCPAPGKGYAQVLTPGYVVRLRVAGQDVEYHTNLDQVVVRCPPATS